MTEGSFEHPLRLLALGSQVLHVGTGGLLLGSSRVPYQLICRVATPTDAPSGGYGGLRTAVGGEAQTQKSNASAILQSVQRNLGTTPNIRRHVRVIQPGSLEI
jgi:hypothetical protein